MPALTPGRTNPAHVFPLWDSKPGEPCPLIVKCDIIQSYLLHLFLPYPTGFAELRCFTTGERGKSRPVQEFFDIQSASWRNEFSGAALHYESLGLDCFCGVLPRSKPGRGEDKDVEQAAYFWADIDFKDVTPQEAKALGAGTASILVRSGNGLHCYFRQPENYILRGPNKDKFIQANRRVQTMLKSDPVHNLSRILRVPGTTNFKREELSRVVLVKYPGVNPAGAVATPEQLALGNLET